MATVILRGALAGEAAVDCLMWGISALIGFALLGGVAGMIMDYLVSQDLETQYRRRVAWFREEFEKLNAQQTISNPLFSQEVKKSE